MEAEALGNVNNMTADEASSWILERTPSYFQVLVVTYLGFVMASIVDV